MSWNLLHWPCCPMARVAMRVVAVAAIAGATIAAIVLADVGPSEAAPAHSPDPPSLQTGAIAERQASAAQARRGRGQRAQTRGGQAAAAQTGETGQTAGQGAGGRGNDARALVERARAEVARLEERGIRANPYRAGRTMTMSRKGIVASSHVLASQAGLDMLRSGGTAMDAAVAAASTLAVVEPQSTSIGGDAWLLYFDAATKKVYALNGSGRSPIGLTREHFDQKARPSISGWETVTVPGAVDAYAAGVARFGKKSLAEVLEPAIRYAEEGYAVTETIGGVWRSNRAKLSRDPMTAATFLVDGQTPPIGGVFKNPRLARSLRLIAEGGRDAYYKGPIAEEIVRYARATGGFLSMEDFAAHGSIWVDPVSINYRGYDVFQCPPNGQGAGVLMMLNILEGYDMPSMKHNSADYLHLSIEAKKLAYADLYKFIADPTQAEVPIERLLSKEYAAERRALINPRRAAPAVEPGVPMGSDTIYTTAIDEWGNACSFVHSVYSSFGSGITGGETGIILQNRGSGFTLERGHANEYAPGKRPYHTIICGMVLKEGDLYISYGLMGGAMQPQGHAQLLMSILDRGFTIQEAVDLPRWRHNSGLNVSIEQGTPLSVIETLILMGHRATYSGGGSFGGSQVIMVDPATGTYFGASDPRKDGAAIGY